MTFPGESSVMPTYARYPLDLVRGEGCRVWDPDGRSYLDFAGGLGALSLGHAHPDWVGAVSEQAARLGLATNLFSTQPQAALAAKLAAILPVPDARVFLCNSGAEANEAAIKLVRKWGIPQGRTKIVALRGSFHGRTVATLAATGQPSKRAAFEPLVDWFVHIEPGDSDALEENIGPDTAALLIEPVIGEGGVVPLDHGYLRSARALCDERGALFIADEVQSGTGRCGEWAAIDAAGVSPDVLTLAKALGGGLPIGACVARGEISLGLGDHGSTFGGGPVPCAAALAVINTIERDGLLENASARGDQLRSDLARLVPTGSITEIRGAGLLTGIELARAKAHDVALAAIERGLLVTEAGPSVLRTSPPLNVTEAEIEEGASIIAQAVAAVSTAEAAEGMVRA